MDIIALAKKYLRLRDLVIDNGRYKLVFFNNFYLYQDLHWAKQESIEIENDIYRLIASGSLQLPDDFRSSMIKDITRSLQAITSISGCRFGAYLNTPTPQNTHLIPLQNCILRIICNLGRLEVSKEPHSSNFFSSYVLPYRYNKRAGCPKFIKFIEDTLPPDEIKLLQEWFGYHLVPITLAQKFMVFYGVGANGKSVVCLVLRLMLGKENVSSVPLQGFHPQQRFALAATEGKLANIIEEIDELKTFPTARLKSFVVGEGLSIEKKFKDDYLMTPTARLTFATNTLPQFRDKSDGLKRRMIILSFKKQILDESKQDKSLIDENFWIESGELSGVFNWALRGLRRLMFNNWQFSIPQSVKDTVEQYNKELNPIFSFLEDYVETAFTGSVWGPDLYESYVNYCRFSGFTPENAISFGRTVGRHFKGRAFQSNPLTHKGKRNRYWRGIRIIPDSPMDAHHITDSEVKELERISLTAQITQIKPINLIPELTKAECIVDPKGEIYESNDKK